MSIITLKQNAQTLVTKQVKKVNLIREINRFFDLEDAHISDYLWFYGGIALGVTFGLFFLIMKVVAMV
ncbi:hypothetical protein Q9R38_25995 [Priestia aryabhattai]|uniref:hypothetical protein n=1 Tax=Priestia aryabhattai TaxID=412384 RepID=UPI00288181A9|nr:hypothetical protein [Priestia aryabhattai]MDT0149996.1 hypothetical protein [Priestia aryabhattai]MDT0155566.1 hypothetical protein [Priestia aryabhattai]